MKRTDIEWTDLSSNPLQYRDAKGRVVWACVKKSAGCANCYSEAIAERFKRGGPFIRAAMGGLAPFLCEKELRHILTAKKIGGKPVAGSRCFLGDMTDVFGDWVPDELLDRLFAVMALRPDVTFQILTKRAERMREYMSAPNLYQRLHEAVKARMGYGHPNRPAINRGDLPLRNCWLGTSVENQAAAGERIPHLLATPAAVRFLSCEPLLSTVRLDKHEDGWLGSHRCGIHWCIVGGESGPGARPMQIEWARSLLKQCAAVSVPVFVKQLGSCASEPANGLAGASLQVAEEAAPLVSLRLKDKKGGDMAEFPPDLRIREFPAEVPA